MPEEVTSLEKILDPKSWTHWPFLPMVKRSRESQWPTIGVLAVISTGYAFAEGANLWSRLEDASFKPCNPEGLLAEGWEVD